MATTARKLVVEVVEARNLLPKDGMGTSSPYARADFDGQRRKTRTVTRDLNPAWNEELEFAFPPAGVGVDPVAGEPLEVSVLHDVRVGPSRRNNFLGRVRLDARQFVRKGEEALIYFPLEKKNFFSWVRGDIGLKVYYVDEPLAPPEPETPAAGDAAPDAAAAEAAAPPPADATASANEPPKAEEPMDAAPTPPPEAAEAAAGDVATTEKPPEVDPAAATPAPEDTPVMTAEAVAASEEKAPEEEPVLSLPPQPAPTPMPRQVSMPVRRPPPPPPEEPMERSKHDLVDKMPYLFVRVVRSRGLPAGAHPHVRVAAGGRHASTREARRGAFFEWDQTFAFVRDPDTDTPGPTLEISVWDLPPDADVSIADDRHFLGGLCFDTADVHARDPPDGPLATQWYRLEGGQRLAGADLMVATWAGTQADEAFAEAWKADSPASSSATTAAASRAKVYVSPKLWLLRLTVIEAQDTLTAPPPRDAGIAVRATLGFQALKTRTTPVARNGGPAWNEDLLFVAAEPFIDDDCLVIFLEVRHGKEAIPVGSASISLTTIERRIDDRKVASKWLDLLPSDEATKRVGKKAVMHMHGGRLHVRVCLDGGYHVADEPPYASSDFRPSARQLWCPPVGVVELGIVGCKGLLPMRTADGKGCTDAYVVAKYGPKWARTRTISDSFDPAWNEQYTWPVYDYCTVLTVGVFDDPPPAQPSDGGKDAAACSRPMGKVRIRLSTLERGRVYRGMYPLIMMLPTGAKRMGDVELAIRFATSGSILDVLHMYSRPAQPAMHHLRPVPAVNRDALRLAAARISAAHLARSEPPLRREVAMWMLDAAEPRGFSMRKLRANWNRAVTALSWVADAARWVEHTRSWRNPTATVMAHAVLVLLAWHPGLLVPTLTLHVAAVGVWKYRRRPSAPAPHPCVRASMAEAPDREELDEEFDTTPSARPPEVVRARYDRARMVGARLQAMVGDVATQAERLQALVSWRDPRATGIFVALCVLLAMVLYVVPIKMVAVVAGFCYLRHPMFRDQMPAPVINFFRRLPSMSERIM
ncbi:multiple C2 domain and transmembrane region protein 16-like [Phragmites australis]|uniref:multiple C2 domain and transmembrane region protein 16-like n=1 Tax=Phragmites australis TaxID=29695 RepID=UPI002D7A34BD|nr:multiple C2 domain and transmembrane region protein 16-like [Phragmites australis]